MKGCLYAIGAAGAIACIGIGAFVASIQSNTPKLPPMPAEGVYTSAPSPPESTPSKPDDAGYRLASIQLGYRPAESDPLVPEMRQALSDLCAHVRPDDPMHVAAIVDGTQKDLAANGINESLLDLCHHLTDAAPVNVRPDIDSVAAGYCVLREKPEAQS